jgi:proteasome lid subunit RPN8/RPN11
MRWVWLALLLAGCASAPIAPVVPAPKTRPQPQPIDGVHVRFDLLLQLSYIQEEFERETVWCLTGNVANGVVSVSGVSPALVMNRAPMTVDFVGCNDSGVVGWFHNHPKQEFNNCAASDPDIFILENVAAFRMLLLSCNDNVFIYRMKGDDRDYRLGRVGDPPAVPTPPGG